MVDTRNDYEVSIGSFKNAINPETKTFREFPKWVSDLDVSEEKKKSMKVAMYCTGGIRCEKASVYLEKKGFIIIISPIFAFSSVLFRQMW